MISQSAIDQVLKEQGNMCWKCGGDLCNFGYELHHCVYTRDIRFAKYLDLPHNLVALCPHCHRKNHGRLTNITSRQKFYKYKLEKGYDMKAWVDSIPMLIHDRFEEAGGSD